MTYIMVDIEADGPCPGLYSMVSLGAVVVEPRCSKCNDTKNVPDNGDTTECQCVYHPVEPDPRRTFYSGVIAPLIGSDGAFVGWLPAALAVSGVSREKQLEGRYPVSAMLGFAEWLKSLQGDQRFLFVSDNNGFDWQFVNYYFHRFCGKNPFGYSSTNLGSLYKGLVKNTRENFKHLRKTKHSHHPVDDAKGNAEAMLHMIHHMGLKTT